MIIDMIYIRTALILCCLSDMFLTWFNVRDFKRLYPEKDWTSFEYNQLAVYFWNTYGLNKGSILFGFISLLIISCIAFFVSYELVWFALGSYMVILYIHWFNIMELKQKIKEEIK